MRPLRFAFLTAGFCVYGFVTSAVAQVDLLPDIIVRESDLYNHYETLEGGRTLLRLSNGTANVGVGKLYLWGEDPGGPSSTQPVYQRVFRDDGTWYDRLAGKFVFHSGHNHIHFEGWAEYRLRQILPGDGVGPIVAKGQKTSFCILDLGIYDDTLPNFDPDGQFHSCSTTVQGLSVGWIDVYSAGLPGQSIDITDTPAGIYWLESVVDPNNDVLEGDETNNATLIQVSIGGAVGSPDSYEPDDSVSQTQARVVGAANSPNLGPAGPQRVVPSLSVHVSGDDDYYRFYMPAAGAASDFVQIDFVDAAGDLDMQLLDDGGGVLETADSATDSESISLNGQPSGWYLVRVYGFNGATNLDYMLTIDPSQNGAPSIDVLAPPAGDIELLHGAETYNVEWSAGDPEGNETWVSVYANTTPAFDGNEILLPTSINTPGAQGFYVVNSSELDHAAYWFYCQVTDGGSVSGTWSDGTVTFVEADCLSDFDDDGDVDLDDLTILLSNFGMTGAATDDGDADRDGDVDLDDLTLVLQVFGAMCQ